MIYLSAQPDQVYFIWQLEIQLRNFHSLGIRKEEIHVVVAYQQDKGLHPLFNQFIKENDHLAAFYTYPDLRVEPEYTSSVRPNILKQHFGKYPELEQQRVFYHDSDILFSRIPDISDLEKKETCYVSDTRSYLDIDYIRSVSNEKLLHDMAEIVGVSVETIEENKRHTGGAQYILKGVDASFWEKVEKDSEALYIRMKKYNQKLWAEQYPEKREYRSTKRGIQAWCADMWAVLWNLWYYNKKVEIHPEMDFSWPYSPIEEWNSRAIQHYSGNIENPEKYFKKTEYLNYMPWYDNRLSAIDPATCSYKIVEWIASRKQELDSKRISLMDSCVVLDGRKMGKEAEEYYALTKTYIQKFLSVDVLLWREEPSNIPREDVLISEKEIKDKLRHKYSRMVTMPLGYIVDIEIIRKILENKTLQNGICIYPNSIFRVDSLFSETFSKVLDLDLLHQNTGKFNIERPEEGLCLHYLSLERKSPEKKKQIQNTTSFSSEDTCRNEVTWYHLKL